MTIAKILVPIQADGHGENVLAHAAAVARNFNAHIVALHARPRPEDVLTPGLSLPRVLRQQVLDAARGLSDFEESTLLDHLRSALDRLGIDLCEMNPPPRDRVTLSWHEISGRTAAAIRQHGRLADLIAVAKPDRDTQLDDNTLQTALHQSGRPVLMCPDTASPSVGRHVLIAWGGTTENARAVAMALDLIKAADTVTILTVGDLRHDGDTEDLADYLSLHGITARIDKRANTPDVGAAILAASADVGADLVVMGAYSHSHTRELVFGGATQHVIDQATVPVLLVH